MKRGGVKISNFPADFFLTCIFFYHSLLLWDVHLNAFPLRLCIHKKDAALVKGLSFSTEFAAVAPYSVSDLQPRHVVKFVVNFEEFLAICLLPKHSADTQMRCRWDQMCAYDSCTNKVVGKLAQFHRNQTTSRAATVLQRTSSCSSSSATWTDHPIRKKCEREKDSVHWSVQVTACIRP